MAEFVLVAGAWLGGWAWDDVTPGLEAAGHGVHPLTLSGLAERRGPDAASVGQRQHVRDIVDAVEGQDLRDVVLVGHSYSGIPVGQAAQRIGDRLRRLVLVDANAPVDGRPFTAIPIGEAIEESIAANHGFWPPLAAEEFEGQGLTPELVVRIVTGSTPHPGASLTEPAVVRGKLAELPATYVKCLLDGAEPMPEVASILSAAGDNWEYVSMDTGHWPMFSQPAELTRVLLDAADR